MHASRWVRIVLDELELDLPPRARHLLETLGHMADADGDTWPSVQRLMYRTRMGRRTVERARADLVRLGLLRPVSGQSGGRVKGSGKGITARYRLALPTAEVIPNPVTRDGVHGPKLSRTPSPVTHNPVTGDVLSPIEVPLVLTDSYACNARAPNQREEILTTTTIDEIPDGSTWEHYA